MSKDRSPATLFSRTMGTSPERFLVWDAILVFAFWNKVLGMDLDNRLNLNCDKSMVEELDCCNDNKWACL
jgi:hypothetical protein